LLGRLPTFKTSLEQDSKVTPPRRKLWAFFFHSSAVPGEESNYSLTKSVCLKLIISLTNKFFFAWSVTHPHDTQPLQVLLNSLYKVLCTVRSIYLCSISLMSVFVPREGHTSLFKLQFQEALLADKRNIPVELNERVLCL